MAKLTQQDIFGKRSSAADLDPSKNKYAITLDLRDFQNVEDGGEITNGKGLSDLLAKSNTFIEGQGGATLFYMLLLMLKQNQAEHLNADPEQQIFVVENPPALGVGSRTGQIRYSYQVNVFVNSAIDSSPDADDI